MDSSVSIPSSPPQAFDCDDEANCVAVEPCEPSGCRTSLDVRIHNVWYNLDGWRKAHPAGSHWIDWYDGRDATEVMDAFHSKKARGMYQRLPKTEETTARMLEEQAEPDSQTTLNFRELFKQLEDDGWWERDVGHELRLLSIWASCFFGSAFLAHSDLAGSWSLSTFLLSLFFTQSGWLGHDYVHGKDPWSDRLRQLTTAFAGLGVTWWSDKHNKHHALTNEIGVDEDIATDPFLYTWAPDPEHDSPLRKIQHLIFYVPFSALFALWRVDTMSVAVDAVEDKRPGAKKVRGWG
jgi:acyl-lipid Delta6-acetylenase / acyl-lipid (9-3)-desaturase